MSIQKTQNLDISQGTSSPKTPKKKGRPPKVRSVRTPAQIKNDQACRERMQKLHGKKISSEVKEEPTQPPVHEPTPAPKLDRDISVKEVVSEIKVEEKEEESSSSDEEIVIMKSKPKKKKKKKTIIYASSSGSESEIEDKLEKPKLPKKQFPAQLPQLQVSFF